MGAQPQDYYDVSLVDGFNIPLRITNDAGYVHDHEANRSCSEPHIVLSLGALRPTVPLTSRRAALWLFSTSPGVPSLAASPTVKSIRTRVTPQLAAQEATTRQRLVLPAEYPTTATSVSIVYVLGMRLLILEHQTLESNCPKAYVYAYDPNGQSPLICAPSTKPNCMS